MCNEIKLSQQIKKQNLDERKQLGQFCQQFGLENPTTSKDHKINKPYKSKHRKYSQKHIEKKNKRKEEKSQRKLKYSKYKNRYCKICKKLGHTAKYCWTKKKINNLEISDDIKNIIIQTLQESESENTNKINKYF